MRHSVKQVQLKGGAKGLLVDVPGSSVISMVVGFNAGWVYADKKLPELPHLMEHLVVGANSRYPTMKDFEAAVEKNGAANNAFTTPYFLGYEMECAAFEFERILELLAVEISTPEFKPIEIAAETGNVREELSRNLNEYSRVTYDSLVHKTLGYPTVEQSLNSLDKTTRDDIIDYYRRTHSLNNLRFIFAGALRKQKGYLRQFDQLLASMNKGRRLQLPKEEPKHLNQPVLVKKDISQLYYRFSQYGPVLDWKDQVALDILSVILTGRYKSWILGEARDRGLAYYIGSSGSAGPHFSSFNLSAYTTPANSLELFRLIADKLAQARRGDFDPAEIDEAKQLLVGRRLRQYKTPSHLINWYFDDYFSYERINRFERSLEQIKKIQIADLVRVTEHVWGKPHWGLSLVGKISEAQAKRLYGSLATIWK